MDLVYYIFSEKSLCETICICKENDYIEKPILQTGIYRMGTLFSKIMTLVDAWKRENFPTYNEVIIKDKINASKSPPSTLSFSRDVCEDRAVDMILEPLLLGHKNICPEWDNRNFFKYLKCYVQYITLCIEQKEFCSVEKLKRFVKESGDTMPKNDMYFGIQDKTRYEWSESEIIDLFSDLSDKEQYYIPAQIKQPSFLSKNLNLKIDFFRNKNTKYEKLEIPLNIFRIYDAIDLILSSMECIFTKKYMIKRCEYCGGLFVTRNPRQKYCPASKDKTTVKTCYQQKNLERQLKKDESGINQMQKSLRTMSYHNFYTLPDGPERTEKMKKHEEFLNECKEWRGRVKNGEKTEADYARWLKSKYKRKYKKR